MHTPIPPHTLLRLSVLLTLLGLLFVATGCEETIDNIDLTPTTLPITAPDTSSLLGVEYETLSVTERDQLAVYLTGTTYDQLVRKAQSKDQKFRELIYQTLANRPLVIDNDDEQYRILSFLVPDSLEGDLINLVILKQQGKPRQAQVMRYPLTASFSDSLRVGLATMGDYRGTAHVHPVAALVNIYKSDLDDCFNFAITSSGGRQGGGGGGSSPGGGGPSAPGGGPVGGGSGGGGSDPGGCTEVIIVTRTSVATGEEYTVIEFRPCDRGPIAIRGPEDDIWSAQSLQTKNADVDCGKLLKIIGVVSRNHTSRVTPGSRDEQLLESALRNYSVTAVASLIDVAQFKSCGATTSCVNRQVAAYLDQIVNAAPTGGLQRSFGSLPTPQLAALLDAVYGSNQNAHVLEAVRYAALKNDFLAADNLSSHLLALAILHKRDPARFATNASNYRTIALFGETYSDEALAYMASNPDAMTRAITTKSAKSWITYSGLFQILAEDPESTVASVTEDWIDWSATSGNPAQVTPSDISIKWSQVLDRDFTTPVITSFDRRHGPIVRSPTTGEISSPEDLTRHEGGAILEGVEWPSRSERQLWDEMGSLLETFSMGRLDNVTEAFLERFKSNKGGTYTNTTLSSVVSESPEFKNTVNHVGERLNQLIKDSGFSATASGKFTFDVDQQFRPQFGYDYNKAMGLTILLNDTEATQIHLEDFQIIDAAKGKWEATLGIKIIDHFGLNRPDVLRYQFTGTEFAPLPNPTGLGFSAWFLLQHNYGYNPFQTEIFIRTRIGN